MRHTDPNEARAAAEAAHRPAAAQRTLARDLQAHRRELSRHRRAGRLAQLEPRLADDAVAGLGAQRHVRSRKPRPDLRAAYQRGEAADADGLAPVRRRACSRSATSASRSAARSRAVSPERPAPRHRGSARRCRRDAVGTVALRRRGAGRQAEQAAEAVEFVNLGPGRALAVLVGEDGDVENRIITLARRAAAVLAARGLELRQCPHRRADPGRGALAHRDGRSTSAARSSTS